MFRRTAGCCGGLSSSLILYGTGEGKVVIPLTQEELAGLAGTSRATVNQVLRALEDKGTVELKRGKTIVTDPAALATRSR